MERYDAVARQLPGDHEAVEADSIVFCRKNLPRPKASMMTDRIVVVPATSGYNTHFQFESVWLFTDKGTLRALGLLLLATVFHPYPSLVEVRLTNPESVVTLLRTRSCGEATGAGHPGLRAVPTGFSYAPWPPERAPFSEEALRMPLDYLPSLILTNRQELVAGDRRVAKLDTLLIGDSSGSEWKVLQGKLRLAELFLNAGLPGSEETDYYLESELGWRGVSPHSHELRIKLPGAAL
ncbi:MAG TPA: hypothetical protein VFN61_14500 [Acidimicrobiales bacterium]|nr:hypothetical protein [Acidimicrobiales bacterium]